MGHAGYGPIGMILVWSSALFWEDSEHVGPMIRALLIGLKNAKYSQNPSSLKVTPSNLNGSTVPRPIFNRDNESGHKIALFNLEHLLHPNNDGSTRRGWATFSKWHGLTCTVHGLVVQGESRSEEGNLKFPPDHPVWLFQWEWLKLRPRVSHKHVGTSWFRDL